MNLTAFFLCDRVIAPKQEPWEIKGFVRDRFTVLEIGKSFSFVCVVAFSPSETDEPQEAIFLEILGPNQPANQPKIGPLVLETNSKGLALGYAELSMKPRAAGRHWIILYSDDKRVGAFPFFVDVP